MSEGLATALLYALLIFLGLMLLFGWLTFLAYGRRGFTINLEGFGIKMSVDAADKTKAEGTEKHTS